MPTETEAFMPTERRRCKDYEDLAGGSSQTLLFIFAAVREF